MTEISQTQTTVKMPQALETFVLQWGDLGSKWGVSRSVAQIHAFLYLAEKPMTAEEICTQLTMARSNVSNSLKELQAWNLIQRVPILGDRREHFLAETDVWEIAARIAAERKEREIDPALVVLNTCVGQAEADPSISPVKQERLRSMLEFTQIADSWYRQMLSISKPKRALIVKLGAKIVNFLPGAKT